MLSISVRSNVKDITKKLSALAYQQLPYATAQALNALAEDVRDAEVANLPRKLDRPTPFTMRSIRIRKASKANPTATVYMLDKTAAYLEPYEFGGKNKLNGRALLKPVDANLNKYGNLQRRQIAKYAGRKDCFIGKVKTKAGIVDGVWQRTKPSKGKPSRLVLLVKFEDAHDVRQHLGYRALAKATVAARFNQRMGQALAKAIATPKA